MASWDYYCVFCGGPFSAMRLVRQEPRHINENEEENSFYHPGVITKAETAWTEYLRCLGDSFHPRGRALLSAIGVPLERGEVHVEPFCSPGILFDLITGNWSTYDVRDKESLIPFHLKCFELFQQVLAFEMGSRFKTRLLLDGSWEQVIPCQDLQMNLLFCLLWDLIGKTGQRLQISYGDPEPPLDNYWEAESGKELLVADPNLKNDLVRVKIHDAWLRIDHCVGNQSRTDTQIPRQHDPFVQLPFEILLMITSALHAPSLINLLHASPHASPHAYRTFDGNEYFWIRQFQNHMPWFFEMHDFLSNPINLANTGTRGFVSRPDANPSHHRSLRRFFAWADHVTTPRVGMTGAFMGVGNRRRIWGVCAHLVDVYMNEPLHPPPSDEEKAHIHSHAVCVDMVPLRYPMPDALYTVKTFWTQTKSEVNAIKRGYRLKIFWENRRLVGLGVVLNGDEDSQLKLIGSDVYKDGFTEESMQVASGDSITGFILYYPCLNGSKTSWCPTAGWKTEFHFDAHVLGISVLCRSGHKADFGSVFMGDPRRPLLAGKDMEIVGLMGQLGRDNHGHRPFRLGLLQMPRRLLQDTNHAFMDASTDNVPRPTWARSTAWLNDCNEIFSPESLTAGTWSSSGIPIWNVPDLHVQQPHMSRISDHIPNEIVEHEPLIWAKDTEDAHNLRRVTGLIWEGNDVIKTENDDFVEQRIQGIRSVKAEFASESGMATRATGFRAIGDEYEWPSNRCVCLEVDGAGGEMITAVSVAQNGSPRAIKLITNRGKEVYWGEENQPQEVWQTFVAPQGNMLIGIVLSFVTPSCWNPATKFFDSRRQSSVVVLSLPMK